MWRLSTTSRWGSPFVNCDVVGSLFSISCFERVIGVSRKTRTRCTFKWSQLPWTNSAVTLSYHVRTLITAQENNHVPLENNPPPFCLWINVLPHFRQGLSWFNNILEFPAMFCIPAPYITDAETVRDSIASVSGPVVWEYPEVLLGVLQVLQLGHQPVELVRDILPQPLSLAHASRRHDLAKRPDKHTTQYKLSVSSASHQKHMQAHSKQFNFTF